MPVIREKSQFSIGPIGVARVSTAVEGSTGSVRIAEAVAQSANQMTDMFFRRGAQLAEKAGQEAAISVNPADVMMIDPVTGAPVAYEPPRGMGIIAQEAYQNVIQTRFQSSIENEIKMKANELAIKHQGSVDRYSVAMSEYIGAMSETADGQFKGLIVDIGTSYLNATRASLAIDQIRRERSVAQEAHKLSIQQGLLDLEKVTEYSGAFDSDPTDRLGFSFGIPVRQPDKR